MTEHSLSISHLLTKSALMRVGHAEMDACDRDGMNSLSFAQIEREIIPAGPITGELELKF